MTQTDEAEIKSLLSSIKDMKDLSEKLNEKYVDKKILAFVREAVSDYIGNKVKILGMINDNEELIFNHKKIHLNDMSYYGMKRGELVSISLGCGVSVRAHLMGINNCSGANCGGYDVDCDHVCVTEVHYHTSDTKDERYDVCSAWDLVDQPCDKVAKLPYYQPKTAKEWKRLYDLAKQTRAKNVLLIRQVKEMLKGILSSKSGNAKEAERSKSYLKDVNTTYVKVDL